MNKLATTLLIFFCCIPPQAVRGQDLLPFKGTYVCDEAKVLLNLDAYAESIEVPNMRFLGKLNGYLSGRGVYGVWLVTSCTVKDNVAEIRLSNDTGADAQTIHFIAESDSLYTYKAIGGNDIRKAVGRKLVRIPSELHFRRTH